MEESAIRKGFETLKDGAAYDNLYKAALCRAQADWLVGINATRLFSVLYRQTLNVGRVMTPTLAMIVSREAAIDAFKPEPFYTVQLECGGFIASGDRLKDRNEAESIQAACLGRTATVKAVDTKEKSEKPPKLYDLTPCSVTPTVCLASRHSKPLTILKISTKKSCVPILEPTVGISPKIWQTVRRSSSTMLLWYCPLRGNSR
jgi:hypothetical protein